MEEENGVGTRQTEIKAAAVAAAPGKQLWSVIIIHRQLTIEIAVTDTPLWGLFKSENPFKLKVLLDPFEK